jgi:RND family efflux transporter MFP subunit
MNPNLKVVQDAKPRAQVTELRRPEAAPADWRRFAEASTPEDFCRSWLALQCMQIGGVSEGVLVLEQPGSETFAPAAFWPEVQPDGTQLAGVIERAIREGTGVIVPLEGAQLDANAGPARYHVAYPVKLDRRLRAVVAMSLEPKSESQLEAAMRHLQWGAGWLEVVFRRRLNDPTELARQRLAFVVQLLSDFLEHPSFEESVTACVTELATFLDCDRVSLGVQERRRVRVVALSHSAHFDRDSNLARAIETAMEEAIDQRETVVWPPADRSSMVTTHMHAGLAQTFGSSAIVTVPLQAHGRTVGAITFERGGARTFEQPAVDLAVSVAALLGPLADVRRANETSLASQIARRTGATWARIVGPGHAGLKLILVALAALTAFCTVATGEYRVTAQTAIEGSILRVVVAPFNGFVKEANVRPGDVVKQGQLLGRLDDRDLQLERVKALALREERSNQQREALANGDRAQIRIMSAQVEQIDAQIGLLDEQLSRTEIVAPFDGVIVKGDLTQSLGAPLERGQMLFEIAPLQSYRVILEIDEHDIAAVAIGQRGTLTLASLPGEQTAFQVSRITPVNTAKDGRNFFRVEAKLDRANARLRPGMEGVGKVDAGESKLIWIWTHHLLDWLCLWAWSWLP